MATGGTPATALLAKAKIDFTLHPYDHDPANTGFGDEAAAALGVDRQRIFKTLVAEVAGSPVLAVVPVAQQLDLKALAAARGAKKATLADVEDAARLTGSVVGGISPLGSRRPLPVVIDASAESYPTIFVSAGKRGLQLELSPAALTKITKANVAPIAH
ncbi:Cys-tRNA(Pro) deacylase [Microlunatus speluncae]|uniref:Cys-tRNA(Pro) deacylase n=1 Tax=Microlunatus speluncae TaxID=2594267 RepID=UPI0012667F4E|nr:Cys-tRNA(Pro) deacylase [Microlunatus speluncae]